MNNNPIGTVTLLKPQASSLEPQPQPTPTPTPTPQIDSRSLRHSQSLGETVEQGQGSGGVASHSFSSSEQPQRHTFTVSNTHGDLVPKSRRRSLNKGGASGSVTVGGSQASSASHYSLSRRYRSVPLPSKVSLSWS